VLDGAGAPVVAASVSVASPAAGEPASRVMTDGAGRFELPAPRRAALLAAWGDGFLPEVALVTRRSRDLVVQLARGGAVRGRVVDGAGAPLAGVRVTALSPAALDLAEAVSDRAGRFHLAGLRPGSYALEAAGARRPVEVRAGRTACAALRCSRR
jgi:hypothetical protein